MNFVAIEFPATGITTARKTPEFLYAALRIVTAGKFLQVIADDLIEALTHGFCLATGSLKDLLVHR